MALRSWRTAQALRALTRAPPVAARAPTLRERGVALADPQGARWPSAHAYAVAASPPPRAERRPPARALAVAAERAQMHMMFTCGKCETRALKSFSRKSYHSGVVIATCPGCGARHLIADNLVRCVIRFWRAADEIVRFCVLTFGLLSLLVGLVRGGEEHRGDSREKGRACAGTRCEWGVCPARGARRWRER